MKTTVAVFLLPVFSLLAAPANDNDLPKMQSFARYEAMMNKSPFAVATALAPPPQAPNFAKDLYIANAAKLSDEGVVTLNSTTDKNIKEYLSTKGPNKEGYSISNIEWSDRVGATKVTISKDGQFATLTFNQALITQPVANAPVPQPQVAPMPATQGSATVPPVPQYNPNVNTIKPAPIPTLPTPPPRVRGVIQRNPGQQGEGVSTPQEN
ncbi:MAG: hypothetical protein JO201_07750 [Verrucomicrobia bacterium]|nr:hypothetical protein [Verrucomicrobiota bacterium]